MKKENGKFGLILFFLGSKSAVETIKKVFKWGSSNIDWWKWQQGLGNKMWNLYGEGRVWEEK